MHAILAAFAMSAAPRVKWRFELLPEVTRKKISKKAENLSVRRAILLAESAVHVRIVPLCFLDAPTANADVHLRRSSIMCTHSLQTTCKHFSAKFFGIFLHVVHLFWMRNLLVAIPHKFRHVCSSQCSHLVTVEGEELLFSPQ